MNGQGVTLKRTRRKGMRLALLVLVAIALATGPNGGLAEEASDLHIEEHTRALLDDWGPCPAPCPSDLDGNGVVDTRDLEALSSAHKANNGVPEGYMIIEGDIMVPLDFAERLAAGSYATNLWTNGHVPYEFNSNVSATNRLIAEDAMREWERVANVNFAPCGGNDCGLFKNHLHIQNSSRNSSFVGDKQWDLEQEVNIRNWGTFIIAHELGHALGLWHEQSRADRDEFILVNEQNVSPCCGGSCVENNFDVRDNQGFLGSGEYGPYDFDSLMQYRPCAFSIECVDAMGACTGCNCSPGTETIIVRTDIEIEMPELVGCATPAECQSLIGQRSHISHFDKVTVSFLYPEADWRFADATYSGVNNGTFLQPYAEFTSAASSTPQQGTVWVQPGTYSAVGTYDKAVTVRAPLGGVTLGN